MAADSQVHVVLINPAGNLIQRAVSFNPVNGSSNVEMQSRSALQVVAVFVQRDLDGDQGGPFWDEYSGNNQYCVAESYDGVQMKVRDVPGGGGGQASVRVKSYYNDLANPTAFSAIDSKYHESVMGSGSNWIVFDDGEGSLYEQKLAEARTLVGYPTA
jgi:hypothetical protein